MTECSTPAAARTDEKIVVVARAVQSGEIFGGDEAACIIEHIVFSSSTDCLLMVPAGYRILIR